MDPNTCLENLLTALHELNLAHDSDRRRFCRLSFERTLDSLNTWIAKGGAAPDLSHCLGRAFGTNFEV